MKLEYLLPQLHPHIIERILKRNHFHLRLQQLQQKMRNLIHHQKSLLEYQKKGNSFNFKSVKPQELSSQTIASGEYLIDSQNWLNKETSTWTTWEDVALSHARFQGPSHESRHATRSSWFCKQGSPRMCSLQKVCSSSKSTTTTNRISHILQWELPNRRVPPE